jgi:AraC-like DNA-binding protein
MVDILAAALARLRFSGTLLFHYELCRPWGLSLPQFPDAVFHYLSRGSATVALPGGPKRNLKAGDLIVLARGEPHLLYSDASAKPYPLLDLDRRPAHAGVIRHGGKGKPASTMLCGYFTLARTSRNGLMELLPRFLHLKPEPNNVWLDTILQRLVWESATQRPAQQVVLAHITEMIFVEVLRSWVSSLEPGEGGWLGAINDPHIGKALQLIHESPGHPWTLRELGKRVGLGRSAFSDRFAKLVGQTMHAYLTACRMDDAATLLDAGNESIAQVAARVGYETASAFSKVFSRHHAQSPARYRSAHAAGELS